MKKAKVAKDSTSPWASRVLLVPKPDGTFRFCIDLRALNRVTVRDRYPLPRMDDVLGRLWVATVFSQIDLKCGYWQLPLDRETQPKTAFITPDGLYECTRLPMGLHNGGASFQRLMDLALGDLKWTACLVYLDDLVVMGRDFAEHQTRLKAVLSALDKANLTLNPAKCVFAADEINCLGHRISGKGAKPTTEKIKAVIDFPSPNGHQGGQRRAVWSWGTDQEWAFVQLKKALVSAPVLVHPEDDLELDLQIHASQKGLGAALMQSREDGLHPVAFISRRLSEAEKNYHSNELECLTLVWSPKKLRHYLFGRRFIARTDNNVVKWLCEKKELKGKFARWMMELQEYDFVIHHLQGKENVVADSLSRYPVDSEDPSIKTPMTRLQGFEDCNEPNKEIFKLVSGVLYKINTSGRGRKHLLVVPSILRRDIVSVCHDSPTGGHFGMENTWAYVSACTFCQLNKHPYGQLEGKFSSIEPPTESLRVIGLDHIGPFKRTERGNRHILVAIDLFSKWVMVVPVEDVSSRPVVSFLLRDIIAHHGIPERLISDWGTAFTSIEFEETLHRWGIKHSFACPAYPKSNGQVARANAVVLAAMKAFVDKNQTNWDGLLPEAVVAINTAKHSGTRLTPFEIVYGRPEKLPHERLFPWPDEASETHPEFVKRLSSLKNNLRRRLIQRQADLKRNIDKKRRKAREYRPGDLVLVARRLAKKGKTKKFLPLYIGPFQIAQKMGPLTFLVEDTPVNRKKKRWRRFPAHVSLLKPFRVPTDEEWRPPPKTHEADESCYGKPIKRTKSGREVRLPGALQDYQLSVLSDRESPDPGRKIEEKSGKAECYGS
ncbi:hypothetical protein GHT06_013434 [Daphnia sinensis]|uniref:Endonuclease n=1 Tax=Daphnia sinensis TaxID=1820382 RepID=A0AAD5KS07_9CRUS|nr:hypothetical protein GHT06_013434 [Daphnia sinensis]